MLLLLPPRTVHPVPHVTLQLEALPQSTSHPLVQSIVQLPGIAAVVDATAGWAYEIAFGVSALEDVAPAGTRGTREDDVPVDAASSSRVQSSTQLEAHVPTRASVRMIPGSTVGDRRIRMCPACSLDLGQPRPRRSLAEVRHSVARAPAATHLAPPAPYWQEDPSRLLDWDLPRTDDQEGHTHRDECTTGDHQHCAGDVAVLIVALLAAVHVGAIVAVHIDTFRGRRVQRAATD